MKRIQKVKPSLQQPQHEMSPKERSKKVDVQKEESHGLKYPKEDLQPQTLWDKTPLKPH
jgi:hypothetical protein